MWEVHGPVLTVWPTWPHSTLCTLTFYYPTGLLPVRDDHFNLNLCINKTLLTAPTNIVLKHSLASTGKVALINAVIISLLFKITYY